MSLASTPYDGVTYCGALIFTFVGTTSNDHAIVDNSLITFDGVDTLSVQSTLNSQWGLYTVTFGVELDSYPDFVRQDLSFDVEIVPYCLNSAF